MLAPRFSDRERLAEQRKYRSTVGSAEKNKD